jgi:hypothetical protein
VSRRLVVVLVTAGFLGSVLAAAPASQAESSTICIGRQDIIRITPGFSLEPTTGTASTVVDGKLQCNGPLEGYRPTGTISTHHEMTYGYLRSDTCSELDVKGAIDYSIPTADGIVVITNHITGTFHPSSDPPGKSGTFDGDYTSGRFWFTPMEGDCVHSPLTRLEAGWISTWRSERRK